MADQCPVFQNLADFIAHCDDPVANGTGAPRRQFVVNVVDEAIDPEDPTATIQVLEVHPLNFDYMKQRFAVKADDGNALIGAQQLEGHKTFLANERRAAKARAEKAAQPAPVAPGVANARIPDPPSAAGSGQGGAQ